MVSGLWAFCTYTKRGGIGGIVFICIVSGVRGCIGYVGVSFLFSGDMFCLILVFLIFTGKIPIELLYIHRPNAPCPHHVSDLDSVRSGGCAEIYGSQRLPLEIHVHPVLGEHLPISRSCVCFSDLQAELNKFLSVR